MEPAPFEVLSPDALRRRTSLKWTHYDPDVLPLWVAEMDVLPADEVVAALVEALGAGDTGYPPDDHLYAEALAEFAESRWAWSPDPGATATCADVLTGIRVLIEQLVPAGGPVLIPGPVYPPFWLFTREAGRVPVPVPMTSAGRLDPAALAEALAGAAGSGGTTGSGAAILLCSPHNPTGVVHTAQELASVAHLAQQWGAHVIADEVHAPLVPAGGFVPWLSVSDSGFAVTSAAKAFNLPALKAALILAGPQSRQALRQLPQSVRFGASHLGLVGHAAAYRSGGAWLDAVNANIASNAELLAELCAQHLPDVGYSPPEATYLAWLDCRSTGLGDDPARAFLRRGRVALGRGPQFGPGGAGHARLNLACSRAVLEAAVTRMAEVVSTAG
jgi:cystathionine beta-lyase